VDLLVCDASASSSPRVSPAARRVRHPLVSTGHLWCWIRAG